MAVVRVYSNGHVVLQDVCVLHEGNESSFSKRCCQCNFSEKFKGREIILEQGMNGYIPSDIRYDDTKHYQIQSDGARCEKRTPFRNMSMILSNI